VWIAKHKPKVDFVLVTGDFARRIRGDELRNQSDQIMEMNAVSQLLNDLVSDPMIVLPAIGPSDLWPEGDCAEDDPQFSQLATSTWEPFLRRLDTASKNSFLKYGCYNITHDGFGIIVLNTEFWSFQNGADGASTFCDDTRVGQRVFAWAESILEGYKKQGMKVLITGNRKYYDEYGEQAGYRPRCLARYTNMSVVFDDVIVGHVFGGSHEDSFNLIQNIMDISKPNVTGVVHVSPAVVPVKNPAIRVYEYVSPGSGVPGTLTDYVQYYADVVQANLISQLIYKEEYRATTAYSLPDFSTLSWLSLFNRMETDAALKRKYEVYKSVSNDATGPTPIPPPADTVIGVAFTVVCGVLVVLAGGLAWYKCRSFKHKTYEQELAEGLR
jgi:hypothetical protein